MPRQTRLICRDCVAPWPARQNQCVSCGSYVSRFRNSSVEAFTVQQAEVAIRLEMEQALLAARNVQEAVQLAEEAFTTLIRQTEEPARSNGRVRRATRVARPRFVDLGIEEVPTAPSGLLYSEIDSTLVR
jgi:hypothetical protein